MVYVRVFRALCACVFAAVLALPGSAQSSDRYAALYEPLDPGALTVEERRYLQAALVFEGYFDGAMDGLWTPAAQAALDAWVADSHDENALVWHGSLLALSLSRRLEDDGWRMLFLPEQGQSVLVPAERMLQEAPSAHFTHWRDNESSLRLSLARADAEDTRAFHNFTAGQNPDGSDTLVLRQPDLAVTSALRPDGSTLYMRSDLVDGLWSTVVVSAAGLDAAALRAVTTSISPGAARDLTVPAGGTLLRSVALAEDLMEGDGALLRNGTLPSLPGHGSGRRQGSGTGFYVSSDGHVLTNGHVVADCDRVTVDGTPVEVVATSDIADLALLRAGPTSVPPARFAASPAGLNADITVAGYPLNGLLTGLNVTRGSVSGALGIGGDAGTMQISAPIQSGNSGGPVLNARGEVVGVVVSKLNARRIADATGEIPQNIAFAIRAGTAADFLASHGVEPARAAGPVLAPEALAAEAAAYTRLVECE